MHMHMGRYFAHVLCPNIRVYNGILLFALLYQQAEIQGPFEVGYVY